MSFQVKPLLMCGVHFTTDTGNVIVRGIQHILQLGNIALVEKPAQLYARKRVLTFEMIQRFQ